MELVFARELTQWQSAHGPLTVDTQRKWLNLPVDEAIVTRVLHILESDGGQALVDAYTRVVLPLVRASGLPLPEESIYVRRLLPCYPPSSRLFTATNKPGWWAMVLDFLTRSLPFSPLLSPSLPFSRLLLTYLHLPCLVFIL